MSYPFLKIGIQWYTPKFFQSPSKKNHPVSKQGLDAKVVFSNILHADDPSAIMMSHGLGTSYQSTGECSST